MAGIKTDRIAGLLRTLPNAYRWPTSRVELHVVDDFLSGEECRALAAIVRGRLVPSELTRADEPDKAFRTSRTCYLSLADGPLVGDVDSRICRYLGLSPSYGEPIQGQHYEVGQQFKAHTDYFEGDELAAVGGSGQRTWTVMIYLNETERGGETLFPRLGATFVPQAGRALVWSNQRSDGLPNPDTLHHAMPVGAGTKTILTKWFRERGRGPRDLVEVSDSVPVLTRPGFAMVDVPAALHAQVLAAASMSDMEAAVRAFQPLVESFVGVRLAVVRAPEVTRFGRGATVEVGRDDPSCGLVSAVLTLSQRVDSPWPFEVADHVYRTHQVVSPPGTLRMYEGVRLPHGRPQPLAGADCVELCVGFSPVAWRPATSSQRQAAGDGMERATGIEPD